MDDLVKRTDLYKQIEQTPSVEARAVVYGEWIMSDWFYRKNAKVPCRQANCSVCNGFMDIYEGEKIRSFCPDCGATMKGVRR